MDFQYEGADDLGGRILWGRVGILVVAVLLFFLMGRCTGGGPEVDPAELDALNAEIETKDAQIQTLNTQVQELTAENQTLRAEVGILGGNPDAPSAGGVTDPGTGQPQADGAATTTTPPSDSLYVVQAGDTLSTIAEQVYGDPGQFLAIAAANGISGEDPLTVGQELIIPANPDSG